MYLLGIDIGTSFIKFSLVDAATQKKLVTVQYPDTENAIISKQTGWAEQSPNNWWEQVQQGILKLHAAALKVATNYDAQSIVAIGIAYQMHGLVIVDKNQNVLRDSIIWCDSRAVEYGNKAFEAIGNEHCLAHLLNSPGNFTAAKLAWVKENEPAIYQQIHKVMLPGDFIAMKLTGEISTTISALSEGIFWDFKNKEISKSVLTYFGFDASFFPAIKDVFSNHGSLQKEVANLLQLKAGIPVTYKAGDQPNNALSLNVLSPGEVAATAGTSGVIYGVGDTLSYDKQSRVNSFAHVNHTSSNNSIGMLLCINGTGILNSWVKKMVGVNYDYNQMNQAAATIEAGSEGLKIFPFGNGAERIFNNKILGAQFSGIDLNKHTAAHFFKPGLQVYAGEPEGAADAVLSIKSGKVEKAPFINTIADGLMTTLSEQTLAIIKEYVTDILLVTDEEIIAALKLVYERMKIIVEPSCVVPFAAAIKNAYLFKGKKVGIILSGGNVDLTKFGTWFPAKN